MTTLTEKFLLYGGAINLAGSVKGKATARHAVSGWEIGLSIEIVICSLNTEIKILCIHSPFLVIILLNIFRRSYYE